MSEKQMPKVGIGVVLINAQGEVLIGKRKGSHAQKFSIPGGHLDLGETFEHAAIREIREETNLEIRNPRVVGVTNNLETYREEGKHYISVVVLSTEFSGELKNLEPEKCEGWTWNDPHNLPQPHFDASSLAVRCYLNRTCYEGIR